MSAGIVIIGSGFAARTLVKNIRKLDSHVPLTLIAADGMEEYSKPELSHVISQAQRAEDLIRQTAGDFAEQFNVRLFPYTFVTDIDPHAQVVKSADRSWQYDKLVLATGAKAFVPPLPGREMMLTLNSLQEYHACEEQLHAAKRVLIVGAGLIGCELAMNFQRAGKTVTLLDNAASILPTLMPPEVSARLQHCLTASGVRLLLASKLTRIEAQESGIRAQLDDERSVDADVVVAATGLLPHSALAQAAGLETRRGIVVDATLQTSHPHIFALGDCAEMNGQVLPFLQPIQLSAMTLAKNLTGSPSHLTLPPMLVKVKTPLMPLQLAGETSRADLRWRIATDAAGMVAKGVDIDDKLRAFVVSEDRMKEAFALLKALAQ